jgi:hypothetical protein
LFLLCLVAAVATFVAIARDDLLFTIFFAAACILSLMFVLEPDGDE